MNELMNTRITYRGKKIERLEGVSSGWMEECWKEGVDALDY